MKIAGTMSEMIQAGGIYKLLFPYGGLNAKKYRPALAITPADDLGDAKFVFITTEAPAQGAARLTLGEADFEGAALEFKSHVRAEGAMFLSGKLAVKKLAQLTIKALQTILRPVIQDEVKHFAASAHAPVAFVPGESAVPVCGKVIGTKELQLMVEASLDGWLTTGRFNAEFERRLANYLGVKYLITVNSGSTAKLVAFSTLSSPRLGDRAIRPGDEVIGVAAGFPTTVNPILQFGVVPVFVAGNLTKQP
jgi:CDP-6-deoxy-D-xylo-4-hexulose-3-dehydrase